MFAVDGRRGKHWSWIGRERTDGDAVGTLWGGAFPPILSRLSSGLVHQILPSANVHSTTIKSKSIFFFPLVCVFQGIVWCAISAGSCISFCTTLDILDHNCSHGTLIQTNQFSLLMTWLQEPDSEAVHWTFYLASRGTGRQSVFQPAESRVRHAKKETWIGTQVHECQCDPQLWRLGNCFTVISLIRCQLPLGDLHYACRAHHYCHFLPQAWPSQTFLHQLFKFIAWIQYCTIWRGPRKCSAEKTRENIGYE